MQTISERYIDDDFVWLEEERWKVSMEKWVEEEIEVLDEEMLIME